MKNINKSILIIGAILIMTLVTFFTYRFLNSKSGAQDLSVTIVELKQKEVEPNNDSYQNEKYFGTIKSIRKDINGSISVDIDFFQRFIGKQAFLEAVKDYEISRFSGLKWDSFKNKYPTYSELEKAVQAMTEEQFEELYYKISWEETTKNDGVHPGGILDAFPNGMIYSKNESTKIINYPLDKNAFLSLFYAGEKGTLDDFIQNKLYSNSNEFEFIIKNGIIVSIVKIFKV